MAAVRLGTPSLRSSLMKHVLLANRHITSMPLQAGASCLALLPQCSLDICCKCTNCFRHACFTGPVSALLSHLQSRLPDPSAEDTNTNLSAYARSAAARSGNVFGVDETSAVADAARKLALSSVSGQELILKGRGLNNIPEEVWQVHPCSSRKYRGLAVIVFIGSSWPCVP